MAETEFYDTSVDSESFNDDNNSDRSSNISVDLYDSDGEPLPGSVASYERAVDKMGIGSSQPSPTPRVTLTMRTVGLTTLGIHSSPHDWTTLTGININHSISIM